MTIKKTLLIAAYTCLLIVMGAIVWHTNNPLPPIYPDGPATLITASNQQTLRSFGDKQGVHRYHITPKEVHPFYLQALLHYEDRWFYHHYGVNPFSLLRAAGQWIRYGRVISGGSTLTMQVARLIDPHSRTIAGKLHQIARAIQLEWHYSKEEILTFYLNLAPFGGNIEGVAAAANKYFGKSPLLLTKNEAALLVVLPQKPSQYRPDKYPVRAIAMRNKVLTRLYQGGLINTEQHSLMVKEQMNLQPNRPAVLAPLLSRYLKVRYPNAHKLHTTIDYALQKRLSSLLQQTSQRLPHKASAALVILHNPSAEIRAYQGSVDFSDLSRFAHVDMARATRSPGSTLKPFIYAQALDLGLIHSQSLLSDIPADFDGYKPQNLNGTFSGPISAQRALQQSLNVPAIQLLNRITPARFEQNLASAGIHLAHKHANLSVGLGGTGTQLLTLAKLYRALASQGHVAPLKILSNELNDITSKQILSPQSSWITFQMLSAQSAPDRVVPSVRRKIAWKTGTSYGYRDFWAVGVSHDYTVAVWVGRPDASPMLGYLGATQAAPLMFDAFDLLPPDRQQLAQPDSVTHTLICWPSGLALAHIPKEQCDSQHQAMTIDHMTPPSMDIYGDFTTTLSWPEKLTHWLGSKHSRRLDSASHQTIAITSVRSGQHYYRSQIGTLPLESTHTDQVSWFINHKPTAKPEIALDQYLGETTISACVRSQCDKQTIYIHP
ncbi:penicillin-binding protein 1C [Pseudoalteromonas luteoviolacea]|uniref:penicillin-binding protein 1C n=1 Tax=Pseudoalteromonas luteoviolacea TaxID=43657 RepID=UPI001EEE7618|nr:penicillin-binding protein 1C [Pseudoalteromonas luteoviolacea]MCF6440019.1 penicillin-binding protein 1C [Pseudoalteromonas luteoviolacea]